MIPLAYPIYSKSGDILTEIPVRKGQNILVSICAYNRYVVPSICDPRAYRPFSLTGVWGEDADVWNPMRFIERDFENQVKLGTYSNL